MTRTPSVMIPLGTKAPTFSLLDVVTNQTFSFKEHTSANATVILFICNHCPFVKHINKELVHLARAYQLKGVDFIAINSNDITRYPEDSPEKMQLTAKMEGYTFPYLYDESQEIAKAYQAACTPDFFVFDRNLLLVYRGQLDDSRPGNQIPVTGKSIRAALDSLLSNEPVTVEQIPSIGCNIKWKD